jgi:hypothetical protein
MTSRPPRTARSATVAAVALWAVLLAGCGDDGPERAEDGGLVEAGPVGVHDLEVGDCFDDPADLADGAPGEALEVDGVPCDDPHDNEVFALVSVPGDGAYPGPEEIQDEGRARCATQLAGYVGNDPPARVEVVAYLFPTEDAWDDGDRGVVCVLYHASEPKLVGSMAGPGR